MAFGPWLYGDSSPLLGRPAKDSSRATVSQVPSWYGCAKLPAPFEALSSSHNATEVVHLIMYSTAMPDEDHEVGAADEIEAMMESKSWERADTKPLVV